MRGDIHFVNKGNIPFLKKKITLKGGVALTVCPFREFFYLEKTKRVV